MKKLLLLAALVLCAAPVHAAPDRFAQMDKNGDGKVDWEEFQAAVPGMKRPAFDTIDTDKNGSICRSEWDAFMKSHMGGQKGMPAGMPAGKGMPAGMGMPPAGMMGGSDAKTPADADKGDMPLIQPPAQQKAAPAIVPPKN